MLVKKKNPEWVPAENKVLKVGETIEITDPKEIITQGLAVAIGENGEEISAYDLYGVMIKTEMDEYRDYMAMKKQEAIKKSLEDQKKELEDQLKKQESEKEVTPAVAEVKEETKEEVKEVPAKETAKTTK